MTVGLRSELGAGKAVRGRNDGFLPKDMVVDKELPVMYLGDEETKAYWKAFKRGDMTDFKQVEIEPTLMYWLKPDEELAFFQTFYKDRDRWYGNEWEKEEDMELGWDEREREKLDEIQRQTDEVWREHKAEVVRSDLPVYVMSPEEEEAFEVTFGDRNENQGYSLKDREDLVRIMPDDARIAFERTYGPLDDSGEDEIRFYDPYHRERLSRRIKDNGDSGKPDRQRDFVDRYIGPRRQEARAARGLSPLPTVVPRKHENKGFRGGGGDGTVTNRDGEERVWTIPEADKLVARIRSAKQDGGKSRSLADTKLINEERHGGAGRHLLGEAEEALMEYQNRGEIERAREAVEELRKKRFYFETPKTREVAEQRVSERVAPAPEAMKALPEKLKTVLAELQYQLEEIRELIEIMDVGGLDPAPGLTTHEQWNGEDGPYAVRGEDDEIDYKPKAEELEMRPEIFDENWWRREQWQQQYRKSRLPQK